MVPLLWYATHVSRQRVPTEASEKLAERLSMRKRVWAAANAGLTWKLGLRAAGTGTNVLARLVGFVHVGVMLALVALGAALLR